MFTPERLTTILESLLERKLAKNRAVEDRRAALLTELAATNEKLNRLYRAIEDGIVDLDAQLKERVNALKTQHDLAQASLDRIAAQANTRAMITPDRLAAFSQLMREKLDTGDTQARKAYLQSVISEIEVTRRNETDRHKLRIAIWRSASKSSASREGRQRVTVGHQPTLARMRLPAYHPERQLPKPRVVILGAPLHGIAPCGACHGSLERHQRTDAQYRARDDAAGDRGGGGLLRVPAA